MNSTALLHRGIAPTPPLPLSFRRNVSSSVHLVPNETVNKHDARRCTNNGIKIVCHVFNPKEPSSSHNHGFPLLNTKVAMQSLLCLPLDAAAEGETKDISANKRKALQELLANNPSGAEKIMKKLLQRYENDNMQTKYEATLAMVAILIHTGGVESLRNAIRYLNELEAWNNKPSDAKRILYRAVIYTLLESQIDAKTNWKTFSDQIGKGPKQS
ncbi:uncharacterized protein LOC111802357 [Cucurbita pepo subsp. pepo]|uniref:uncharacterized protein LOC111802357 n=1 Tax=Cucurbita pepo subsp. pepo TaxID=3664 RepID=UPI000C9D451E|nr:uncharacterized protein LOC111802357 [Cucurbita pepo subsp. pepo]